MHIIIWDKLVTDACEREARVVRFLFTTSLSIICGVFFFCYKEVFGLGEGKGAPSLRNAENIGLELEFEPGRPLP